MYDDLVEALRRMANTWLAEEYKVCAEAVRFLTRGAADAIEELSADCDMYRKCMTDEHNKAARLLWDKEHCWIPVTERLPEEYTDVLCYYEYFRYGDYNCMFRTIDRGYYGNGRWGGEAGQGHKNKVLAWMPLPSPPAEE